MFYKSITNKPNAWIGVAVAILPGVTIGKNSIVAAGAIVSNNIANNSIVVGLPAKFIKSISKN